MDLATLQLVVDSTQVTEAGTKLDQLGAKGEAAGNRVRTAFGSLPPGLRSMVVSVNAATDANRALQSSVAPVAAAMASMNSGAARAAQSVHALNVAGGEGVAGVGAMRRELGFLAAEAAGLNPRLVSLGSHLALLGVSSVLVVGTLAALAAIGVAIRAAKADTDTLTKAFLDQQKAIGDTIQRWAALGDEEAAATQRGLELQRQAVQAQIAYLNVITLTNKQRVGDLIEANKALIAINAAIEHLSQQRRDTALKAAADEAQRLEKVLLDLRDANIALTASERGQVGSLVHALFGPDPARALHDLQAYVEALKAARNNVGLTAFQGNIVPGMQGTVGAGPASSVPAFLAGSGVSVTGGMIHQAVADSHAVAQSWADTVTSAAQMVQMLGVADDSMVLMLHNAVSVAAQMEKVAKAAKTIEGASTGDLLSLFTAGGALLSSIVGLFGHGESPQQRLLRESQDELRKAVEHLTSSVGDLFNIQVAGGQVAALKASFQEAVGEIQRQGALGREPGMTWPEILARHGLALNQIGDLLRQLDLLQLGSAEDFLKALQALDVGFPKTLTGQLAALQAQFKLFDVTNPIDQLRLLQQRLDVLAPQLLGKAVNIRTPGGTVTQVFKDQFDVATAAGRAALLKEMQSLFTAIDTGNQDVLARLGGLGEQDALNALGQMADLLNSVNQGLDTTVQSLRDFVDSLKLNTQLTTLSPIQQLAEARRQYDAMLRQAQAGDATAAGRLPASAQALLTASRAVNASGPVYAATFAQVLKDMEAVADQFGAQTDAAHATLDAMNGTETNTKDTVTILQGIHDLLVKGGDMGLPVQPLHPPLIQMDAIRQVIAGNQAFVNRIPDAWRALEAQTGARPGAPMTRTALEPINLVRAFDTQTKLQRETLAATQATTKQTTAAVKELQASVAIQSEGLRTISEKLDLLQDVVHAMTKNSRALEGVTLKY